MNGLFVGRLDHLLHVGSRSLRTASALFKLFEAHDENGVFADYERVAVTRRRSVKRKVPSLQQSLGEADVGQTESSSHFGHRLRPNLFVELIARQRDFVNHRAPVYGVVSAAVVLPILRTLIAPCQTAASVLRLLEAPKEKPKTTHHAESQPPQDSACSVARSSCLLRNWKR